MVSYLVAKGATGIAAVDIQGKSRKELTIENRNKTEINISKRNDTIQDHDVISRNFLREQMTYHLDMQATQTQMT